ncbi:hypothetical protein TYRP_011225 [Tyrophagus putrescentiae]|nr:hypothetical protein TYRP_011225 [Tyrophagus putrescentiae]
MSNEDFETWFLDKHGLKAAKPTAFNATQSNWLRASVATYSVHLRLATALNLPLVQWLWLVNGALLGLAVVLVLLLAYLLQMMISLQKAQVHLLRKLEEIYGSGGDVGGKEDEKGEKDRVQRKGSKSKISGGGRPTKKKEKKKSKQSKSSASPKRQTSPKGTSTSTTTTKKSRSKSPSPTTTTTATSPTTSTSAKKKTN